MIRKFLEVAYYISAMAFQRAAPIVVIPIVSRVAGIDGVGQYTVAVILAYLLAPIISLGGVTPIMREGAEDAAAGRVALVSFHAVAITIAALTLIMTLLIADRPLKQTASAVILAATAEASFQMVMATLRTECRHQFYLVASILRGCLMIAAPLGAVAVSEGEVAVAAILFFQAAATAFGSAVTWFTFPRIAPNKSGAKSLRHMLLYSLPVIPHNVAMWAMSAAGRVSVYLLAGATIAGYFGAASAIASICALVNVTASTFIPRLVIAQYDAWVLRTHCIFGTIACFAIAAASVGLMSLSLLDSLYVGIFDTYFEGYYLLLAMLCSAFIIAAPQVFYLNVFVKARMTSRISIITPVSLLITAPLFYLMTFYYGMFGAAFSGIICQALSTVLTGLHAAVLDPRIKRSFPLIAAMAASATLVVVIIGMCFDHFTSLPRI